MAGGLTKDDLDAALAKRSGRFAWRDWAPAVALMALGGIGLFSFNDRLVELQRSVHADFVRLEDKIDAVSEHQARDEGGMAAIQRPAVSPSK
jgi:hypothetical protein